jgi:hypothetical protein
MEKLTGMGGLFFRARDTRLALGANLGVFLDDLSHGLQQRVG